MIKYKLGCAAGHEFEAWFVSMDAFDRQAHRGLVSCPECASTRVEKRPMAPAIVTTAKRSKAPDGVPPDTPAGVMMPVHDPASKELIKAVREMKAKLLQNSEHVGVRFAEEARRIHFGETETRSIHGEATPEDAQGLCEDGVAFGILPMLPDEQN